MSTVNATPAPNATREVVREVLRRPEFKSEEGPRLLDRLFDALPDLPPIPATVGWVILAVLVVGVALLLLYLLRQAPVAAGGPGRRALPRPMVEILEGAAENARDALELALRSMREGDYRRALWIGHRLLLSMLDAQGALRFSGWKTNGRYLQEVSPKHPAYGLLLEFTEQYEKVIYAHRDAQPEAIEALLSRVARLAEEPRA